MYMGNACPSELGSSFFTVFSGIAAPYPHLRVQIKNKNQFPRKRIVRPTPIPESIPSGTKASGNAYKLLNMAKNNMLSQLPNTTDPTKASFGAVFLRPIRQPRTKAIIAITKTVTSIEN
jgi:hypothetical protein